ncbi:MAG: hypothetical protein LBH20_09330 [Treponema sp.]|jgi:hypothetical protein|nr:hypothetical protein [Treponema sp.]
MKREAVNALPVIDIAGGKNMNEKDLSNDFLKNTNDKDKIGIMMDIYTNNYKNIF